MPGRSFRSAATNLAPAAPGATWSTRRSCPRARERRWLNECTLLPMDEAEARFHEELESAVNECRQIGYNPTRFMGMLARSNAFDVVRSLLQGPVSDGFTTLWEKRRLDLSVEAIALKPEWRAHFTVSELEAARRKLLEVNYRAPWDDGPNPQEPVLHDRTDPNPPSGFVRGSQYTREEVQRALGLSPTRGGNWDTGYHKHAGEWFLFPNLGRSRTGHDYGNKWVGSRFLWYGRTGSRRDHPTIQDLTAGNAVVHLFTREADRNPFTYQGLVRAAEVRNTTPVEVIWEPLPTTSQAMPLLPEKLPARGTPRGRPAQSP